MEQTTGPLTPELLEHGERQRSWVRDHYVEEAHGNYETVEGKLHLLETILSAGWIEPGETWKLQSLGITFGDALIQELGLEWITVTDDYGCDPAVRLPGTSIVAFPLTAISKRIERGETVDVRDLFAGYCREIRKAQSEGA